MTIQKMKQRLYANSRNPIGGLLASIICLLLASSSLLGAGNTYIIADDGIASTGQILSFFHSHKMNANSSSSKNDIERGIAGVRRGRLSIAEVAGQRVKQGKVQVAVISTKIEEAVDKRIFFPLHSNGSAQAITFPNLHFRAKSFAIPAPAYRQLDAIGAAIEVFIQQFPSAHFQLEGIGVGRTTPGLLFNRANSVKRFILARFSIKPNQLIVTSPNTRKTFEPTNSPEQGTDRIRLIRIL